MIIISALPAAETCKTETLFHIYLTLSEGLNNITAFRMLIFLFCLKYSSITLVLCLQSYWFCSSICKLFLILSFFLVIEQPDLWSEYFAWSQMALPTKFGEYGILILSCLGFYSQIRTGILLFLAFMKEKMHFVPK